jgi:putative flippase GtrA
MNLPFLHHPKAARLRRAIASGQLREIVLFLVVGGTSALLYTALNVLFTKAGLRPSLSILLTLAILIPPTYLAQRRFTFRSDRDHWAAFPRYAGTQVFGNALALLVAEIFPTPIRSHPLAAFILIAIMVAVTNYGMLKFWAFRRVSAA